MYVGHGSLFAYISGLEFEDRFGTLESRICFIIANGLLQLAHNVTDGRSPTIKKILNYLTQKSAKRVKYYKCNALVSSFALQKVSE